MKRDRATKIMATLGPASDSYEIIEKLFLKGVDVFRLNFSHGTWEQHEERIIKVRSISKKYNYPIGIMQDLQGPKLRVGVFEKGAIILHPHQEFIFDLKEEQGNEKRAQLPHPEIFQAVKPGMCLLLDDGRIKVKIQAVSDDQIITEVLSAGPLSNHKGVNVPDVKLPLSALTPKDLEDLKWGQEHEMDYIALSFVQTPQDIYELRSHLTYPSKIIAKLEKPSALHHLDEIIRATDAVMVARGDLGVEIPPEKVPSIQRHIIRSCRQQACPVIVATQMLDSMVERPIPTRAEASDVASAVYDGVDAVMLSAESASGNYPVESVDMMNRIIQNVEKDHFYRQTIENNRLENHIQPGYAIAAAARQVAHSIHAKVILTLTEKGSTTLRTAYERPQVPIIALTPNQMTAQQLTCVWGVYPVVTAPLNDNESVQQTIYDILKFHNYVQDGDHIVMTLGPHYLSSLESQAFETGSTRVLRILTVGEEV